MVQFGLLAADLKKHGQRGQGTVIVQLYNIVIPGLICARHIFEGLERRLYCDENKDGDLDKLVYSWRPSWDYECINQQGVKRPPPDGKIFAVIVTPNIRHKDEYPEITGWINRWNWVDEDPALKEAPLNWVDRYNKREWTRP